MAKSFSLGNSLKTREAYLESDAYRLTSVDAIAVLFVEDWCMMTVTLALFRGVTVDHWGINSLRQTRNYSILEAGSRQSNVHGSYESR